ncbi:hypothetical protein DNTS_005813 [Danionella cerebrum]|uniref:CWF19-like protein 2 n=1 Tax=Danionella cerebrum TaxID=2873325 RepID=A0A553PV15_9TELE|nr:hypothetical protein DNTS_005813 [Danionella translucida]
MTFDFLAMKTTSVSERRAQKEAEKEAEREKAQAIEQAGLHRLELNPYWKDGGSGLPPEESSDAAVKKAGVVNDGGLSWLRKSHQRMKEQAEREQRSLESVVAERYGSLEEFQKRLREAEEAVYGERREERPNKDKERQREEGRERRRRNDRDEDKERWRKVDREERMERWKKDKQEEGKERWRKDDGEDRKESWRREERDERWRERSPNNGGKERGSKFLKPLEDDVDKGMGFSSTNQRTGFIKPNGEDMSEEGGIRKGPTNQCKAFRKPASGDNDVSGGDDEGAGIRKSSTNQSTGFRKPGCNDNDLSGGMGFKKNSANQSTAFRKPIDDEMSREGGFRKDCSTNQSTGFRKADSSAGSATWRKSSAVQDSGEMFHQKHAEKSPNLLHEHKTTTTVSSSESEEEEEEEVMMTDEEMNKLGAKIVKAEIMGNTVLVEKLKAQMDAARRTKEKQAERKAQIKPVCEARDSENDVVLFRTDASGRAWPVNTTAETLEPRGGRRKRKAIETHQEGERVRYFEDDDGLDLREMVRREKMSSAEDQNALYSRMAAKMMGRTDGDNYTLDDMFVSSAAQKERAGRDEERQRNKAVYLCLPNGVSLTEGHCLIVPVQHHTAATALDEDLWSEIQMFRQALVRMFACLDLDCVFMETHMNPKRQMHMVYECVPLPKELGDMAPIYFKKAIMESDEEWAMNKKVVDLSSKDVRQAVPRGLPYFSVVFGLQGGFAHVIENEQKFPHYFGKEILGGMLDLEPRRWRKLIRENFDDQRKKVLKFAQWWKPYDCTKTES